MQPDIAIVVVAYNRPHALERLLTSLQKADYKGYSNIPIIISIDYAGSDECYILANNFEWAYGEKKIICYKENLGLKKHILQCGDLSLEYDAIIVLEDDLFVSPVFFDYAQQSFSFYKDDKNIAGIALYNYRFNEIAFCPFEPISDGYDNYFLQVPCSCGQLWTKEQWQLFKEYLNLDKNGDNSQLPDAVLVWPSATSWKKIYYRYLLSSNRYFVYPCTSLTTNFGDKGQHHDDEMLVWQTPLLLSKKFFRFSKLSDSIAVYDAFFELDAKAFNKLTNQHHDVCIDVNGTKQLSQINNEYLLSSKKCHRPIKKYALNLYPYMNNVLMGMEDNTLDDNYFSFGETKSFKVELNADIRTSDIKRVFFNSDLLIATGKNHVYRTKEYRIGKAILKPLLFLKKRLKLLK